MNRLVFVTICSSIFLAVIEAVPGGRSPRNAYNSNRIHRSPLVENVTYWNLASILDRNPTVTFGNLFHSQHHPPKTHHGAEISLQASTDRISIFAEVREVLNFDFCSKQDECPMGSLCKFSESPCSPVEIGPCRCIFDEERETNCTADADCRDGEVCAGLAIPNSEGIQHCYSATALHQALVLFPVNESAQLLSGETCRTDSQCVGERVCTITSDLGLGVCTVQNALIFCESDDDCTTDGEVCALWVGRRMRFCLAKALAEGGRDYTYQGLTADNCILDQDCLGERECLSPDGSTCRSVCLCSLRDPELCTSNDDCISGLEACAQSNITGKQECISRLAPPGIAPYRERPLAGVSSEPSLEPTEEPVCVDASSLSQFRSSELVYAEHVVARVLCDVNGSCATAGHMVQFRGTPMRMSSYCRLVDCVPSMMLVNSPRLKLGLRISTKTDGLRFTALAAKFDTLVEEMALKTVLRFGM